MFILSIDQGTSSTKSIIFDDKGNAIFKGIADLHTDYFSNGFVEQDPNAIFESVLKATTSCINSFLSSDFDLTDIKSCGISNQRETFVLWDETGQPLCPAVVWACKRSVEICNRLSHQNVFIKEKTGLLIDPYFSATKLLWIVENNAQIKAKLESGDLFFGTIDCWLLYKLSGGQAFKTDYTNAHRTLLFNIYTLSWDIEILNMWGLEKLNLPDVFPSSHDFGTFDLALLKPNLKLESKIENFSLPLQAMIGDSHAASFGEKNFEKGTAKITMGTGSSMMLNIGNEPIISKYGMLTTVCWSLSSRVDFAFEGAIVACGSTIEWLKNELGFFENPEQTSEMAERIANNGGVYLVPAFSGLGAPHWHMDRRASIHGMTFGTSKAHIVRAALEAIAFQIKDVVSAMEHDLGEKLKCISINGGLSKNKFLVQFLADLLKVPLRKQSNPDISALGAAYLAGLYSGVYVELDQLSELNVFKEILPNYNNSQIDDSYNKWCEIIQNP